MANDLGNAYKQGARGALGAGHSAIKGLSRAPGAIKRSARAAKKGASGVKTVALIIPFPFNAILIGFLVVVLLLCFIVAGTSNVQMNSVECLTPLGSSGYQIPEYESEEDLQKIFYDKEYALEDTKKLLSIINIAKVKDRNNALNRAVDNYIARYSDYAYIDREVSIAAARVEGKGNISISVPNTDSLSEEQLKNASVICEYLINSLNLTPAAAFGVLGNIQRESGYMPGAVNSGSGASGICQWLGGRLSNLNSLVPDWKTSIEGQLDFLNRELNSSENNTYTKLLALDNSEESIYEAADIFCRYFERPGHYDTEIPIRQGHAVAMYQIMTDSNGNLKASQGGFSSAITSNDYKILAAYSVALSNGQTINRNGEILDMKKIPLKKDWNIFSSTFGQVSYEKTLKARLEDFIEKGSFYEVTFAENEDGGYLFVGTRTVREFVPLETPEEEEKAVEKPGKPSPGISPTTPINVEKLIKTPMKRYEETVGTGGEEAGTWEEKEETYYYLKPIIREKRVEDVLEDIFEISLSDPYIGSMFDKDGDGIVDESTASSTNRAAILSLATNTIALMGKTDGAGTLSVYGDGILSYPLPEGRYSITSYFGYRYDPEVLAVSGSTYHGGVDLSGYQILDTPILAAADGVVSFAGWESTGGNMVIINHGNGLKTTYAHMIREPSVHVGQSVSAGTILGNVGSTGASTGPHLHFGVDLDGVAVDPLPYLGVDGSATEIVVGSSK